jgi:hypothetical protein
MSEGLYEILFHLLWTKDSIFESTVKAKIPDTVIYQYYQPRFWYFTSVDGLIKRKSKDKLKNTQIQQQFLKKVSKSGIVALLLFTDNSKRVIEYLDVTKFVAFINESKESKNMILQKFIDPAGEYNHALSILWSTNFCLFEKKKNRLELYNDKYDIYEKAVTFEGKDYHASSNPIRGTQLPNRLLKIAESIVGHIAAVTFDKMRVLRMVLQMKLDSNENIWLICATSLRFSTDANRLPVDLNVDIEIPNDHNIKNLTVHNKSPAVLLKDKLCGHCMKYFELTKVTEILYGKVFEMLSQDPVVIKNLHPGLKESDLKKLKSNTQFMQKKACLCFDCYILINDKKTLNSPQTLPLIGTGPLQPSKLKTSRNNGMSTTKYSSVDCFSTHNSILAKNATTRSMVANYSMGKAKSSKRILKTAGGELVFKFPDPK